MNAPIFKRQRKDSRKYLDFLRQLPCIVTGRAATEPAHLRLNGTGGTGIKPEDCFAVPLNYELHRQQNGMAEGATWLKWAQEHPLFLVRLAQEYPELYFRWLLSVAEARFDEWRLSR